MGALVQFPGRITQDNPAEQFEKLRGTKARHMLAAVIRQVGPVSFTADDLANEEGIPTAVYDPKENEWVIKLEGQA